MASSNATITVVGLGPAGPEYLTAESIELLGGPAPVWLRTERHPAAAGLAIAGSFDSLYESLGSFDEVYAAITWSLIDLARQHGTVVYAVPGSPAVAERTVEMLRAHGAVASGEITLDIRAAMAFIDLCWNALGIDPMAESVTIVDALALATQAAGRVGPMLITQVHSPEVLDDVITLLDDVAPDSVTILQGLGTPDENVEVALWADLRTSVEPDHLTSLWIPRLAQPLGAAFRRIDERIRELRESSPQSLHDSLQTLRSSIPTTADAVLVAIDQVVAGVDDAEFDLEDGLADLLYLLVEHARVAAEAGFFTIDDLAESAYERRC